LRLAAERAPEDFGVQGFSSLWANGEAIEQKDKPTSSLVSGAKPRTPKGSSTTAQGASPGFKVQIAESPERAAQGVRSQLQINARHKAPLWYRNPLHRPFEASLVTVLVPRARALGSRSRLRKALKGRRREFGLNSR